MLNLEGDPLAIPSSMHKRDILGALTWMTTIQGILLPPGDGAARTAALLVTLARQQQHGWREPTGIVTPKAPTPREQQLAVLASPPGVRSVFAARLLDHFGGLRSALDADAEALAAVPGIGEELAARFAVLSAEHRAARPGQARLGALKGR